MLTETEQVDEAGVKRMVKKRSQGDRLKARRYYKQNKRRIKAIRTGKIRVRLTMNQKKAVAARKRTGQYNRIAKLYNSADQLPATVLGEIAHSKDYINTVLEVAAAFNDKPDAREFAKFFLDRDPVYSNTKAGLHALMFENWLADEADSIYGKLIETHVSPAEESFLAIFEGKLTDEERKLVNEKAEFIKAEMLLEAGAMIPDEGEVSDVTIIECFPVKGKHYEPKDDEASAPIDAPKPEDKPTDEALTEGVRFEKTIRATDATLKALVSSNSDFKDIDPALASLAGTGGTKYSLVTDGTVGVIVNAEGYDYPRYKSPRMMMTIINKLTPEQIEKCVGRKENFPPKMLVHDPVSLDRLMQMFEGVNEGRVLPTENESYGFYGTCITAGKTEAEAKNLWDEASKGLKKLNPKATPEQIRDFLDSRIGRHIADQVAGDNKPVDTVLKEKWVGKDFSKFVGTGKVRGFGEGTDTVTKDDGNDLAEEMGRYESSKLNVNEGGDDEEITRLTFGKIPAWKEFEAAFDDRVEGNGYNIKLSSSDSKAAEGTSIGDGRLKAPALYKGIKELIAKGDEDADDLASSILYTLGFEWV